MYLPDYTTFLYSNKSLLTYILIISILKCMYSLDKKNILEKRTDRFWLC